MKKFILLFVLFISSLHATQLQQYTGNITHPTLELLDIHNVKHNLSQYKNNIVLMQFWATYCPPCIKEMPSMNHMQEKLKKRVLILRFWQ